MRNKLLLRGRLVAAFAVAAALTLGLTGTGEASPRADEPIGVISLVRGEDGRVVGMNIYTPAPGWTEQRLAEDLRAHGTRDVVVTADPIAAMQAADRAAGFAPPVDPHINTGCKFNTANTNGCPPSYWSNNGYANPVVDFVDHTSSAWPVSAAVPEWNKAMQIDSVYLWNSCTNIPGIRCVDVWNANYGATGWHGITYLAFVPGTTYRIQETGINIKLNDYYGTANNAGRKVACHEIGHALGLWHATAATSCMWPTAAAASVLTPSSDDLALLDQTYSIYRQP